MDTKPPITGTMHALPFGQLSPRDFERLCLWLVEREGYNNAEHLGAAGSEQGRDVVAWKDAQLWAFQCKRYQTFATADALREIDKIAALPAEQKPVGLVFVVTSDVSVTARQKARERCRQEVLACDFWAGTELDERTKRHPDILAEFFQLSPQAGGGLPPHMLRPPVGDFTGRTKEIESLMGYLSKADKTGCIAVICGMGGVGKSELALKVADRLRERHPDTDLMFELQPGGRGLTPKEVLAMVVRAFRPEEKLPDDLAGLQAMYRQVMTGKRGLLLLDNAGGPEQVRPLLPAATGWAVLVTTQGRFSLPGAKPCDLDVFPLDDAVALLYRLFADSGRDDLVQDQERYRTAPPDEEQLRESPLGKLAEQCGRLPLALRVAAGHLTSYADVPLAYYLTQLETARLKHLTAPGEPDVAAVLGLSVQPLEAEEPLLAWRWRELAVFPAPFDWAAAAAVWGDLAAAPADDVRVWPALKPLTEEETRAALSALVQRNLAEYERETATYGLHDLLREWALDTTEVAMLEGPRMRHAWHYLRMGKAANDLYERGGEQMVEGLRLFEAAWPHLAAAFAGLRDSEDREALRWLNKVPGATTYVLDLQVMPGEQIQLLTAAAGAAHGLGDRRGEGAALGNLGLAYAALGEVRRAIDFYEEALAISREIGDRRAEGAALGNLGNANADLGEVRRAIEYLEQALAISREIGDRRSEGNHLGNLGLAYVALGEVRRAIEYYEQALAISREIGDRRSEGADLGNLGNAYAALGEVRRAIDFYEEALAISREIGDLRAEGATLGNLGLAYAALGEVPRAIEYYEEALAISREIGDRRGEGADLGNLGLAYAALGEVRRAIEYYEQGLAISREIGDRRGEGADLGNLGNAYADLGEVRWAIEYYEQGLTVSREIGDRRDEGNHLGNLGLAYAALGEVRRAIEYYEQGLTVSREIGDRRGEGADLGNLGLAYAVLGEVPRAIEYYEEALAISREIGDRRGEGSRLGNLGNAYADLGEVRRAIEYLEQALAISREIGDRRGEGSRLGNLGNAYADLGEVRRAIEYYEQGLAISREIGDRRSEGNALANLGLAHKELGDIGRARELWEEALRIYEEIESPHADSVRGWLAENE